MPNAQPAAIDASFVKMCVIGVETFATTGMIGATRGRTEGRQ
jgi:hypothetical protein